jgi:hypothetical protein
MAPTPLRISISCKISYAASGALRGSSCLIGTSFYTCALFDLWLMLHTRFGIYSIDLSINAGLDLEMPGTNKWRVLDLMNRSIGSRKLTVRTVKERARKVVELAKRVAQEAPEVRTSLFHLMLFIDDTHS